MLNPANNKLFDVLEEANKLFANGNICTSFTVIDCFVSAL